ncbi:MAG: thiosulfate oxidation carrier complex protein SoxZ [Magnetococcales bacterium]|nr:thiosulfate oxidation carrier complex protein SoxZ [Magnetococcales bacterium]
MAVIGRPKVRGPKKPVAAGTVVTIKTLIKHPMESGRRKNKDTGELIPAHYIDTVEVEYGGKVVIKTKWTGGISKNPYFSFSVRATASGPVKVTWKDNKGGSFSSSADLKVS